MRRRYLVSKILLVDGVLLLVLAFAQFLSTPLINKWLSRQLTEQVLHDISLPYFLNHITVGILLIPFGVSTLFSAVGVRSGQGWARGIALTNALAVLLLPLFVVLLMGPQYFDATLFFIAAIIVIIIGLSMILPLLWLWSNKENSEEQQMVHHHHLE